MPESKRYAESKIEYTELLRRHNEAATYCLGENSICIIFAMRFGSKVEWQSSKEAPLPSLEHVLAEDLDGDEVQFFASPAIWRRNSFDEIIVAKADDRIGPVLFANPGAGSVYAPYDGGADLFFQSSSDAAQARGRFQDWLSTRPDGM